MKKTLLLIPILSIGLAGGLATAGDEAKGEGKKKATTLTGCLSSTSDEAVYKIKTKSQEVEVRGSQQLKDHVGHEVKLTGTWMEGASASSGSSTTSKETSSTGTTKETTSAGTTKETTSAGKSKDRHLMVSEIQHVASTCTTQSSQ